VPATLEFFSRVSSLTREVGITGLVDITMVTLVIYTFLVVVERTQRSGLIFTGILITGAVYLAARKFDLRLTAALLQGFFAVILVALVVIFQEELRYFFERVALWWVERRLPLYKRKAARLPSRDVEILARTLGDLARARVGALVVMRGKDLIARHLVGGEDVDGLLGESLIKSIFDPHSPGHDGAVVIEGKRIARLGCHLPLSKSLNKLSCSGTRHAAGSMDALFMSFTLELFDTPEIPDILREGKRVLRSGGRIVVVGMSKSGPTDPLVNVFEWTHKHFPNFLDCRPIYVRRAIEEAGFNIRKALLKQMWIPVEIILGEKE
jgi:DNA integrity scanning protein DisA with diadenylate cyclase activity